EDGGRNDVVHQAQLPGLRGADRLPGEDEVQSGLEPDELRQALGAARARKEAELDLGEPELVRDASEATRPRQASAHSRPPPRQAPWMAATTGLRKNARRSNPCWPSREARSPSEAVRSEPSQPTSAPTTKSCLAEVKTIPLTDSSLPSRSSSSTNSDPTAGDSVFTDSPGRSKVTTATSPRTSVRKLAIRHAPGRGRRRGRRRRRRCRGRSACSAGPAHRGPASRSALRWRRRGGRGRWSRRGR